MSGASANPQKQLVTSTPAECSRTTVGTFSYRIMVNFFIVVLDNTQASRLQLVTKHLAPIDCRLPHGASDEIEDRLTTLHEAVTKVVFL